MVHHCLTPFQKNPGSAMYPTDFLIFSSNLHHYSCFVYLQNCEWFCNLKEKYEAWLLCNMLSWEEDAFLLLKCMIVLTSEHLKCMCCKHKYILICINYSRWPETKALPGADRLIRHLSNHGVQFALASNSIRRNIEAKISFQQGIFLLHLLFKIIILHFSSFCFCANAMD